MAKALRVVSASESQMNMLLLKESLIDYYNAIAHGPSGFSQLVVRIERDITLLKSAKVVDKNILFIKATLRKTLLGLVMYEYNQTGLVGHPNDLTRFLANISQ